MGSVGQRTRLGNSEMSAIFDELAEKNWAIEPVSGTRVKALGPNGEGPVYLSLRAYGREVKNQMRNLRANGFVFSDDSQKEEEEEMSVQPTLTVVPPAELTELPAPIDQMLEALRHTISNEMAALKQDPELEQWQQMYQEADNKVKQLEKELAAEKARATDLESKWKTLKALFKD